MLKTENLNFLRDLLTKSFREEYNLKTYNIKSTIEYILLDASDIWFRIGDAPYGDCLIYSCIELALYRNGYPQTARRFCEFCHEEHSKHPRMFEEEEF